jgi:HlyD family secretion protein
MPDPGQSGEAPLRVNPPGRWVNTPQGERIFLLDPPPPALEPVADPAGDAEQPLRVNPPGRWVNTPQGERIFLLDPPPRAPESVPDAVEAAEPPLRVNPPGRWVVTPEGERIYLVDPPPRAPAPLAAAPAAPAAAAPDPAALEAELAAALPELPDEGLQEIIAHVPALAVRWGAGVIAAVMACLLLLAGVVRYPEVVPGQATVTTPTPPVRVAAGAGGDIQELLAADDQQVQAGDVVAVLRSSARWRDVRWVRAHLERPDAAAAGPDAAAAGRPLLLGEVQQPWGQWLQSAAQYRAWASDPFVRARVNGLRSQMDFQQRLGEQAGRRAGLLAAEAALAEREAQRGRELVARELLSRAEAEQSEAAALSRQQALIAARAEVVTQGLRVEELEGRILEMEQGRRGEETRLRLEVQQAFSTLAEAVREWETRYLLVAPVTGHVSYVRTLSPGEYVTAGEPVLALVPGGGAPSGTVRIDGAAAGRVRPGQRVLLSFEGFPVTEFGKVEARVQRVSLVPARPAPGVEGGAWYRVTVTFPRGLRTTSGRALALRQEMSGSAEIVTDDLTVLQRLMAQFRGRPAVAAR